ncbi:MAG: hypothetical protein DIU59_015885 [Pseudomonadota bacterium]|jgi:hypothetical protein|nr:MAG: hypothetical protein DIU59_12700 [Pseudomonadota bacterium]GGG29425.1 hypothetical protein GCM10008026_07420 [Chelatococcus composti]
MSPDQELAQAWHRILTDRPFPGDGKKAVLWLRRQLLEVMPPGSPSCAVHEHEGARRLAATILGFAVSADDDDSERRGHGDSGDDADDDLNLERLRQRYAREHGGGRARGVRRRVPA